MFVFVLQSIFYTVLSFQKNSKTKQKKKHKAWNVHTINSGQAESRGPDVAHRWQLRGEHLPLLRSDGPTMEFDQAQGREREQLPELQQPGEQPNCTVVEMPPLDSLEALEGTEQMLLLSLLELLLLLQKERQTVVAAVAVVAVLVGMVPCHTASWDGQEGPLPWMEGGRWDRQREEQREVVHGRSLDGRALGVEEPAEEDTASERRRDWRLRHRRRSRCPCSWILWWIWTMCKVSTRPWAGCSIF